MIKLKARYQIIAAMICLSLAIALISIGYLVAPVLFAELGKKQAGEIAGILFSQMSWVVLISLMIITAAYLFFEKSLASIKSLLVSLLLVGSLKFWITAWMVEIKLNNPLGVTYGAADWRLFASLHGVYQLFYLVVVILLIFWSVKTLLTAAKPVTKAISS